jgi:hypothetical protein
MVWEVPFNCGTVVRLLLGTNPIFAGTLVVAVTVKPETTLVARTTPALGFV